MLQLKYNSILIGRKQPCLLIPIETLLKLCKAKTGKAPLTKHGMVFLYFDAQVQT